VYYLALILFFSMTGRKITGRYHYTGKMLFFASYV